MKINHITQVGSVALAILLTVLMNSCVSHETNAVTPINLPKIQGVTAAPAGLAGKTLKLVSSEGKVATIRFKDPKYAPIVFNGNGARLCPLFSRCDPVTFNVTATYNKDQQDESNAWIDFGQKGDDAYYVLYMKFSTFQKGTYKLEEVTCSDGSKPWIVIEKGTFSIQ